MASRSGGPLADECFVLKRDGTIMKDAMDSTAARQAPERTHEEEFVSRKLIRPSLSTPAPRTEPVSERRERLERTDRMPSAPRRSGGSEQTHAENYYYQKQVPGQITISLLMKTS